jgi:hypothetical protein
VNEEKEALELGGRKWKRREEDLPQGRRRELACRKSREESY